MSYASVAKENREPESEQPHPDPNLLEGHNKPETEVENHIPATGEKINVVSQEVKDEIEREEKRAAELAEAESQHFKRKVQEVEDAAGKDAKRAKAGAKDLDRRAHQQFQLNPKLWTGVMGAVNVVSFAAVGYLAYANWNKPRWDRRVVAGVTAGLAALLTPQGVFAGEEYQQRK